MNRTVTNYITNPWVRVSMALCVSALAVGAMAGCRDTSAAPTPELSVEAANDGSVSTFELGVRAQFVEANLDLAGRVIERGGTFRATVFGGGANAVEVGLLTADPETSLARRRTDLAGAPEALRASLEQALGLRPASPELAARLDTLPPTSAVSAALAGAVEKVRDAPGTRVAVVISDGLDHTLHGARDVQPAEMADVLSQDLAGVDASGVIVALVGIGEGLPAADAARLIAAWQIACDRLNATTCVVTPDLAVSTLNLEELQ